MKKNISIILNVLIVIMLLGITYAWMQTEPSLGENIEYNRDFYITDSDIDVLSNRTITTTGKEYRIRLWLEDSNLQNKNIELYPYLEINNN